MSGPTGSQTRAILHMEITPATKLVLLDLIHIANDEGIAHVSPREVAERTTLTARGVYKALASLTEADLAHDQSTADVQWAAYRPWKLNLDRIHRGQVTA